LLGVAPLLDEQLTRKAAISSAAPRMNGLRKETRFSTIAKLSLNRPPRRPCWLCEAAHGRSTPVTTSDVGKSKGKSTQLGVDAAESQDRGDEPPGGRTYPQRCAM
jgi:hypothetical protein